MKIANEFTVSAPIEQAWDVLSDLEQVIPLMPGAQLVGREGDDFLGKVKVKVGPVTSEFSGKVHFVERDREQHRAVIDGKGKEARGTGNAAATVTAQLHADGERTRVTVDTDLKIVGKLAQFGSGMLQQVSEKLLASSWSRWKRNWRPPHRPSAARGGEDARPRRTVTGTATAAAEPAPIDLLELAGGGDLKKYGPSSLARARAAAGVRVWAAASRRRR